METLSIKISKADKARLRQLALQRKVSRYSHGFGGRLRSSAFRIVCGSPGLDG
jgi:hypothetical protein